jgi:hypothetical protein
VNPGRFKAELKALEIQAFDELIDPHGLEPDPEVALTTNHSAYYGPIKVERSPE